MVSDKDGFSAHSDAEGWGICAVGIELSRDLGLESNLFTNTTFLVVRGEAERGSPGRCGCGVELKDFFYSMFSLYGTYRWRNSFEGPPEIFI